MESVTREQLDVIVKLQEVEIETVRIKAVLNEAPKKLNTLDEKLKEFEKIIEDKQTTLKEAKKKYRESESEVQMNLSSISKKNEKLSSIKTNKEYSAILKEIEEITRRNSQIEDVMLGILDEIADCEKNLLEKNEEYKELKEEILSEKEDLIKEAEKEEKKLRICEEDGKAIMEKAVPELLERYNLIRERSKGIAIVSAKKAVCQGCYMNIPPQMYNELQRCDTLKFCPHCQRIIYYNGSNGE